MTAVHHTGQPAEDTDPVLLDAHTAPAENVNPVLLDAHTALAGVVRDLVEPRRVPVSQQGRLVVGEVPSLLRQLQESVSHGRSSGPGGGGAFAPLNTTAADTLTEVAAGVRQLHLREHARAMGWVSPQGHLRALADLVSEWQDPLAVRRVVRDLTRLRDAVVAALVPDDEAPLRGEICPDCDAEVAWQHSTTEQGLVRADPLRASASQLTVRCLACGRTWPAGLAGRLIQQRTWERWYATATRYAATSLAALREVLATDDPDDAAADHVWPPTPGSAHSTAAALGIVNDLRTHLTTDPVEPVVEVRLPGDVNEHLQAEVHQLTAPAPWTGHPAVYTWRVALEPGGRWWVTTPADRVRAADAAGTPT